MALAEFRSARFPVIGITRVVIVIDFVALDGEIRSASAYSQLSVMVNEVLIDPHPVAGGDASAVIVPDLVIFDGPTAASRRTIDGAACAQACVFFNNQVTDADGGCCRR